MKNDRDKALWKGVLIGAAISAACAVRAQRLAVLATLRTQVEAHSAEFTPSQAELLSLNAATMSELRNPLKAIRLYANLLRRKEGGVSAETTQRIANGILLNEQVLTDLLNTSAQTHNDDLLSAEDSLLDATASLQDTPPFLPHRPLSV